MKNSKKYLISIFGKIDWYFLILVGIFLVVFTLMLPLREQSYADDFGYAQSVRHFLTTGNIFVSEWSSASLIFLIYWGSLFSKILGFSFKSLQISVLPFLLITILSTYQTLIFLKVKRPRAFIFSIIMLGIPWFLQYSYSFMTDIVYMGFALTGLMFITRTLNDNSKFFAYPFFSGIFLGLAFLTRQHAVTFACPFMFLCFLRRDTKNLFWFGFPFLFVFLLYSLWYSTGHHITQAQVYVFNHQTIFSQGNIFHPFELIIELIHRTIFSLAGVLGLMCFVPLIFEFNITKLWRFISKKKLVIIFGLLFLITLATIDLIFRRSEFILGIPWELFSYDSLNIPWAHLWKFMVASSFLTFVIWVSYCFSKVNIINSFKNPNLPILFIILVLIANFGFLLNSHFLWGSYNIPIISLVIILLAFSTKNLKLSKPRTVFVCLFMLIISLEITKTRYELNGILWEKAIMMVEKSIPPYSIEIGNYTWKPWYYFEDRIQQAIVQAGGKEKMNYISPFNDGYPPPKFYMTWTNKPNIDNLTLVESTTTRLFLKERNINLYQVDP